MFAKTFQKLGFQHFFFVFVVWREEKQKMITGISGLVFVQKCPLRDG